MNKASSKNPIIREKTILLGFAVQRRGADGRVEIGIRWGRLFGTFLALVVIAWLSVAGALYFYFKYRKDFGDVEYLKMVQLPFRLEEHRVEMGDYHVERGLAQLQEGEIRDAIRLLGLGVTRSPANLEGRQTLAEVYQVIVERSDIAADLMVKGLEHGGIEDTGFVKATLRLLLRNQMDETIQELADTYLTDEPTGKPVKQMIAFGAANANYLRGNYDQAEDYLRSHGLTKSLDGLLLSSKISWDRGNEVTAINKLESSMNRFPNSEPLLMQLSQFYREMGDLDSARRFAILRNIRDPLSPAPRLELLYIYHEEGETEREKRETSRMLRQFRDDQESLQALANFAADTGNVALARRTYEEALESDHAIDAFALLLIEAHLVREDYEGALAFAEELLKERPDWLSERWAIFSSLRAVASFGIDRPDLGDIYLQSFLEEAGSKPQTYLAVARRFINIDREQQARKVLSAAYRIAPSNQKVLSELIRTDLKLGITENLDDLLRRLLKMRQPEIELLAEAYQKLGSDLFIFTPNREALLLELGAILREKAGDSAIANARRES